MNSNSEPLQGSLFEGSNKDITHSQTPKQTPTPPEKALSCEALTKDAKNRPRHRKTVTETAITNHSSNHNETLRNEEEDLPAWAHHTLVNLDELTPMLRHYVELKISHPKRILLYRLGDFFECFFEDAIQVSDLLELTLTGKDGGKKIGRVPMAGIPHHAAERYCAELIKKGLSVALCDQIETTASKGNLLRREITRILTPGTVLEEGMLTARRNNWLAAVITNENKSIDLFEWGLASADVSTGEFLVTQRQGKEALKHELANLRAAEVITARSLEANKPDWCPEHIHLNMTKNTPFSEPEAKSSLLKHYALSTIDGLGLQESSLAIRAAGGLLAYLHETNPIDVETFQETKIKIPPLDLPRKTFADDCLIIDAQTRRNLELTATQRDGLLEGSLLWAVDRTLTSMGGRCLRRWLEAPLNEPVEILNRQGVVTTLVNNKVLRKTIRSLLRAMADLERLAGRAGAGQASARDLIAIADGLERLPRLSSKIHNLLERYPEWMQELISLNPNLNKLASQIRHQLINNPPIAITEGGLIHDGVDPLLDGLRNQLDDQDGWLKNQENEEKKKSKNPNLKLQYHRTFGYFLSVTKAKANQVPDHWIRRQTLTNEERFITPDLKNREGQIIRAKALAAEREYEIFCKLRKEVGNKATELRKAARAVAGLDALTGLAEVAATCKYCPPQIIGGENNNSGRKIQINDCRHPVVEQLLGEEEYIANDIELGNGTDLIILTGPNASGKSCFLRQIGLVQILTQIGSWVPARNANISIADQIFTRVGAVDDLAAGQSTFMVEMAETAFILNNATQNSLVLLDEIGRGTATFDGLSIALSVSEFLAEKLLSRTIFATHYHELNALSKSLNNVSNLQVLVEETGDSLIFSHKVIPGGASKSYGIEAARLAGVPIKVVERAHKILKSLQVKDNKPIRTLLPERNKQGQESREEAA